MERGYIPGIAGLRSLAVLSVVMFHINRHWLSGGFVGVDLFFVISGFVVAHSVMGAKYDSFLSYFSSFYKRRFQRILPAAFLYILVASIAALAFVPLVQPTKFLEPTGIAAIFGLSNFVLFLKAGDYFAVSSELNLFTHTWSLAVEEQYYVIFPFFSYLILVARHRFPRLRIVAIWTVAALCAGSLVAAAVMSSKNPSFAFYMLPTRFWELGMGFFLRLFLSTSSADRISTKLAPAAPVLSGAAMIGLAYSFWFTDAGAFPFPGAVLPCVSTALLIAILWSYPGVWVDRMLSLRPFVWFGDISYSLYLWHWGVVVLMRWTVGIDTLPLQLFALTSMIALSWLSYTYVEQVFNHRARKSRSASATVFLRYGTLAASLAVLVGASYMLKPRFGMAKANEVSVWDSSVAPDVPVGCEAGKQLSSVGPGMQVTFPTKCARSNAPRLIVIGDSHAGAYMRTMLRIAASGEFEPYLMTLGGCRMVAVSAVPPVVGCPEFIRASIRRTKLLARKGDVIFLAGIHTARFSSAESSGATPVSNVLDPAMTGMSRERLRELSSLGATVIVEGPKPVMPVALYRCADWFNEGNPDCRVPSEITPQAMWHRMETPLNGLRQLANGKPNIVLWEPAALLCEDGKCMGYRNGRPLFYDHDHLSGYGNDLLLPRLVEQLRSAHISALHHGPKQVALIAH